MKNTLSQTLTLSTCAFLLVTLLTACSGWHLRGSDTDTNSSLNSSVYLSGESSQTYQLIKQRLTKRKALALFTDADLQLTIGKEQWKRRSASVNSSAATAEYELTLILNYEILDKEKNVLRPSTDIRITRSYTFNQNDIAGKDKEEIILRRDLQRAVSRQILQQLQLLQR